MIKVVLFSANWDTGGQGYRIKVAFDKFQPDFSVRAIHSDPAYFDYPQDLVYNSGSLEQARLFEEADVLHFRNDLGGLKRLGHGQPLVLQHHGTRFREYHAQVAARAKEAGAIQIASTIDLTVLEPGISWVPSPYNLDQLSAYRPYVVRAVGEPVRIAHAPTNREVKSTVRVMEAVHNLSKNGYNVTFDLIERKTWQECLTRKGKADIYVDQLKLGYGNNAIEAWGMGIPVVAGIVDPTAREAMLDRWGSLPFLEANQVDLEGQLAKLIVDAEYRTHWASIGLGHIRTYHDEAKVAAVLADIYRSAVAGAAHKEAV